MALAVFGGAAAVCATTHGAAAQQQRRHAKAKALPGRPHAVASTNFSATPLLQ